MKPRDAGIRRSSNLWDRQSEEDGNDRVGEVDSVKIISRINSRGTNIASSKS